MSNRFEILEEYREATTELSRLKHQEAQEVQPTNQTITIQPRYGKQMNQLSSKCAQLDMILEAMEASED
ncbi:hypothetical protein DCM90_00360 [Levilactobacillus bambusae]|uniref:Uncharacterized protein n=1 Tax=Levilactobacillus bambusae TaxID=2024736 RepID=A0A2V1N0W7_9LACO|nr:hypothetical protein DCM90_00360 [Levilactobacillus bambusae]